MSELVYTVLFQLLHFLQKSSPICSIIPMHTHKFTDHSSQTLLMQRKESSAYYLHIWTNKQNLRFSQQCSGLIYDEGKMKHPRKLGSTSIDCNNILDLEYMAYFGWLLNNSVHKNKFHIANTLHKSCRVLFQCNLNPYKSICETCPHVDRTLLNLDWQCFYFQILALMHAGEQQIQ